MELAVRSVSVGLSYMYEPAFNRAMLPLLESGEVDALEWSFDTVQDHRTLPEWISGLLKAYSDANRLYGHGVYYSLFSGHWGIRQTNWLRQLQEIQQTYSFRHISEHFGFMSSGNAHNGAPMPVPFTDAVMATGLSRLRALQQASNALVGIENLALAFAPADVRSHSRFLQQLVAPVGGFVLLDLHNLYCQAYNFGIDVRELLISYPLERVREIHLSGGSWASTEYSNKPVRRDTHDAAIPEALFEMLLFVLSHCPNLDVVIMERLGDTLFNAKDEQQFREDFLRIKKIVKEICRNPVSAWPFKAQQIVGNNDLDHDKLVAQQNQFLQIIANACNATEAKNLLLQNIFLMEGNWQIEQWTLPMIETVMKLGAKWGIHTDA